MKTKIIAAVAALVVIAGVISGIVISRNVAEASGIIGENDFDAKNAEYTETITVTYGTNEFVYDVYVDAKGVKYYFKPGTDIIKTIHGTDDASLKNKLDEDSALKMFHTIAAKYTDLFDKEDVKESIKYENTGYTYSLNRIAGDRIVNLITLFSDECGNFWAGAFNLESYEESFDLTGTIDESTAIENAINHIATVVGDERAYNPTDVQVEVDQGSDGNKYLLVTLTIKGEVYSDIYYVYVDACTGSVKTVDRNK